MDKKYQIFISSTYEDLISERNAVRDVILKMYQFPIGMEMFSAADEEQWEIIQDTIDSSDYYILIIGKRYGSVINDGIDAGISYTEKEYRYAKSIGLPILVYIKEDNAISANYVDNNPNNLQKLEAFKTEVMSGREVKWFSSTDQLGTEVTLSLHKEMDRKKRPGWVRSDAVDIEKSLSENVELSRQNRELQEENKSLHIELENYKSALRIKPSLEVSLDQTEENEDVDNSELYHRDDIMSIDEDGIIHLKLKDLNSDYIRDNYKKLTLNDVPTNLTGYVTSESIANYNDSLPSKEQIDKYVKDYELIRRLKENGVAVTTIIKNNGKSKATDVTALLEFPEQIQVFDIDEINQIGEIAAPKLPDNPINAAVEKRKKEMAHALNLRLDPKSWGVGNLMEIPDITKALSRAQIRSNMYQSFEIESNTIQIEDSKGIVHTRCELFKGAYIVPLTVGTWEAKVTLMCAEYEAPETKVITFVVEQ